MMRSVADVGCGEGSNLLYLERKFPNANLFGFDISDVALNRARLRVKANFGVLDIEKESVDQRFDFVLCSDVLEHIQDDISAMRNLYNITEKYALVASVQGRMRESEIRIGHVRNYDPGDLGEKLELVGFDIVQVVEWGYPLYSLYRDLVDVRSVQNMSFGRYGPIKKMMCDVLYLLFMMNRSNRGDIVAILVRK
jgi:SAM-dependent methyltransferase